MAELPKIVGTVDPWVHTETTTLEAFSPATTIAGKILHFAEVFRQLSTHKITGEVIVRYENISPLWDVTKELLTKQTNAAISQVIIEKNKELVILAAQLDTIETTIADPLQEIKA